MNRTRMGWAALIVVVIILIGFALSVPHTRDTGKKATPATTATSTTPVVSIHDSYKKGTHTISGSLILQNACGTVSAVATLLGDASSTQTISLALSAPTASGVCLQVPTKATFSTTLAAPSGLPISVSVNDLTASTTLQ